VCGLQDIEILENLVDVLFGIDVVNPDVCRLGRRRTVSDTDVYVFETVCQIRGNELDGAGTYELVHRIRGKATPDELVLGSFTRRKLMQLPIWDLWLALKWKQLDAHQKQEFFGKPYPAPPDATVLRPH
jgi:hypothetical protein